jgi:2-polyprenyl-3-methyl-5-hydroxy-6-metoxy-1,4-benzoquinol methylase
LPFLAVRYSLSVTGLDYTKAGCESARRVLQHNGVVGRIVLADLFDPPNDLLVTFDAVVSFGVVEHFDDTASAMKSVSEFCRPGGFVITSVPTMRGIYGLVYRLFNRPVYRLHHPLSRDAPPRRMSRLGWS